MNRRDFFKWLTGGAAIAVAPKSKPLLSEGSYVPSPIQVPPPKRSCKTYGILEFVKESDVEGYAHIPVILGLVGDFTMVEEVQDVVYSNIGFQIEPEMESRLLPMHPWDTFDELQSVIGKEGYFKLQLENKTIQFKGVLVNFSISSGNDGIYADVNIRAYKYFVTV